MSQSSMQLHLDSSYPLMNIGTAHLVSDIEAP